jgi:hypothetical protein
MQERRALDPYQFCVELVGGQARSALQPARCAVSSGCRFCTTEYRMLLVVFSVCIMCEGMLR